MQGVLLRFFNTNSMIIAEALQECMQDSQGPRRHCGRAATVSNANANANRSFFGENMQSPQLEDQLFNYVSHLFAHCLDLVGAHSSSATWTYAFTKEACLGFCVVEARPQIIERQNWCWQDTVMLKHLSH